MQYKAKRGFLIRQQQLMRMVSGLKPAYAVKFFKDTRKVTEEIETTQGSIEAAKPAKLEVFQKEFANLKKENQEKSDADILKNWKNGKEFQTLFDEFKQAEKEILNQEVKIMFSTVFPEKDLPTTDDVEVGEMLVTYFLK